MKAPLKVLCPIWQKPESNKRGSFTCGHSVKKRWFAIFIFFFPTLIFAAAVDKGHYKTFNSDTAANAACSADAGDLCGFDLNYTYFRYAEAVLVPSGEPFGRGGVRCRDVYIGGYLESEVYCTEWVYSFTMNGSCPQSIESNPQNGECLPPGKDEGGGSCPKQTVGNPINVGVGNKYQIETDFSGSGIFPLSVERSFNSISRGWRFFSEVQPSADFSQAVVVRPDGQKLTYGADGSGGWVTDPDVTGVLESFDDGMGTITGWRYTTQDDWAEDYDASGRLVSVTNRTGVSHTYSYSSTDITVTHSNGDVLEYQLDGLDRIIGFTTPDNDQFSYNYDAYGRLADITYPNSGGTRIYHYENIDFLYALTGITDANGNRFATWTYDIWGRAISSEHNNGVGLSTIDYTYLNDATDPRVTVTNSLSKDTTYHFTALHGVRKVTQVEGHPTANCVGANKNYTYDANGFLDTVTDWEGNITDYDHDSRGLEIKRVEAKGTAQERTILTEWESGYRLPKKITEPDRVIDFTYDANGQLLERKEIPN